MTVTIGSFIALLLLLLAWRNWKATARDAVRDTIIDLRDEWRNYYVDNNFDMRDGCYADMRDLLNGMLRYTKRMRMIGYFYFAVKIDKAVVENFQNRQQTILANVEPQIADKAKLIRRKASEAILAYMAATSLGFISAVVLMTIYLLPSKIINWLKSGVKSVFALRTETLGCAVMCPA